MTRTHRHSFLRRTVCGALVFVACATSPAHAQPLNFDNVATNAAGFNSAAFTSYNGYTFENFGVLTSASLFGTGNNAVSPTKFAYAQADGSSYIYRTDASFNLFSAYLSFRQLDQNAAPATVTVRGYRTGNLLASYTRNIVVTNAAQRIDFSFENIEELEFETTALQANGRSAVLAVDDVNVSVVPEPASLALVTTGLVTLLLAAGRARRRS